MQEEAEGKLQNEAKDAEKKEERKKKKKKKKKKGKFADQMESHRSSFFV
jgi:hypothetical protein